MLDTHGMSLSVENKGVLVSGLNLPFRIYSNNQYLYEASTWE